MNRVTLIVVAMLFAAVALTAGGCTMLVSTHQKEMTAAKNKCTEEENALNAKIKEGEKKQADTQKQLDETTTLAGEMKKRLEQLGQNVTQLTTEKSHLSQALAELAKQKAVADARAAEFRGIVEKLRSMIDAGKLKVIIRNGRMIIALPNDVLFDSGRTNIKKDGQDALAQVAQVLTTIKDRNFLVAGHTDNVPIRTERFPSNWELSTERAVVVTQYLIANNMDPTKLAAAGYGEFDPVVANDTPEHKAQNRRIEIVMQPNLSELPGLEDIK
jgi:chemotaxis protein MotB